MGILLKNNSVSCEEGIAVSVMNISKQYILYKSPKDKIKDLFSFGMKMRRHDFWALRDVTFSVPKGKCIGIIGENGSGKSTLLKIISGTLYPTSGEINAQGRISSLLELGIGFNGELTGRENILLQGEIVGYSRAEMKDRSKVIEAFADIGAFIEQPVKCYSSGMHVRLGFACAIHTDPDILVIDEALAVGDIGFQRKCYAKIDEMLEKGKTFIFVSHSMDTINSLCDYAILLKHGRVEREGIPKEVTDHYLKLIYGKEPREQAQPQIAAPSSQEDDNKANIIVQKIESESEPESGHTKRTGRQKLVRKSAFSKFEPLGMLNTKVETRLGNDKAEIIDFGLIDEAGQTTTTIITSSVLTFVVRALIYEDLNDLNIQLVIRNRLGISIFWTSTAVKKVPVMPQTDGNLIECRFKIVMKLGRGKHFAGAMVLNKSKTIIYDYRLDTLEFEVFGGEDQFGGDSLMNLDTEIQLKSETIQV